VEDGGVGSRSSRRKLSEFDDLSASLLDSGSKLVLEPGGINQGGGGLSLNGGVPYVRVHGWGVIAPDRHLCDVVDRRVGLKSKLGQGSVVVESGHSSKVLSWDSGSVMCADQSVGVGWVSDNNGLDVRFGVVVDGFAGSDEDLSVVLKQISSLHAWASGLGSNKEVVVNVLEADSGISSKNDIVKGGEGAVVELCLNSLEGLFGPGNVNQVQDDGLVFSEELATKR